MMICSPRDEKNFAAIEELVKMEIPRMEHAKSGQTAETETVSEDSAEKKPARRSRTARSKKSNAQEPSEAQALPAAIDTAADPAPAPVATAEESNPAREQSSNRRGGRGRGRNRDADSRDNLRGGATWDATMPNFIAKSFTERLVAEGRDPSTANDTPESKELPSLADGAEDLSLAQAPQDTVQDTSAAQEDLA
jgi:superfamily II DNA/RNA helicase